MPLLDRTGAALGEGELVLQLGHLAMRTSERGQQAFPLRGLPQQQQAQVSEQVAHEEIEQVVSMSIESAHEVPDRHVDYDTIRAIIEGILNEEPSEDDVDRVTERLRAGGWPVIEDADADNEVRDVS